MAAGTFQGAASCVLLPLSSSSAHLSFQERISSPQLAPGALSLGSCKSSRRLLLSPSTSAQTLPQSSPFFSSASSASRNAGIVRASTSSNGRSSRRGSGEVWLGRLAMLVLVADVTVEVQTGHGLLQAAGVPTPLPVAFVVVFAFAGVVAAFGVLRSGES